LAHVHDEIRVVLTKLRPFDIDVEIILVFREASFIKLNFVRFGDLAVLVSFILVVFGGSCGPIVVLLRT
jgi:hypothetical protein